MNKWSKDTLIKKIKALPLLATWGIWLAHNALLFKDRCVPL
jgi:hypothetical protein